MAIQILMPALSPTMEEGTLAKWLVKEGDVVKSGDILAEIETDKATMEFEAVDEGTIGKIMIAEGTQGVKVNTPIAVLLEEGEDASAVSAPAATEAPETKGGAANGDDAQGAAARTGEAPQEARGYGGATDAPASADGQADAAGAAPVRAAAASADKPAPKGKGDRVFASPLARRIAAERGIDLSGIAGSGPKGRIVKSDVEGAEPAAAQPAAGQPTAAKAPAEKATAAGAQPAAAAPAAAAAPKGMGAETVRKMLKENGRPPQGGKWADIALLEPVRDYKARHASTLLTFDAVVDAIGQIEAKAKQPA